MKNFVKYTWVGKTRLYHLKRETKKPITLLVAEAISEYLDIRGRA